MDQLSIGVDIGGTKIAAGVVDPAGRILHRATVPTPADPTAIDNAVADLTARLYAEQPVQSLSVAAAGLVSSDRSTVMFAPNISWRSYPLAQRLSRLTGESIPIVVENDANAAGWAEYRFGAGQHRDMLMLTIGTGVGGAVVTGGRLLRGASGAGAEVGHVQMVDGGIRCGCGQQGCLEAYASRTALERAARQAASDTPERAARLLQLAGSADAVRGRHVAQAVRAGDELSTGLIEQVGGWIGRGAATLSAVVDPALIVIGGGLADLGETLLRVVRRGFGRSLTGAGHRPIPEIAAARLGNDAGIVGAADLARHHSH